jgi:hypothetical protein
MYTSRIRRYAWISTSDSSNKAVPQISNNLLYKAIIISSIGMEKHKQSTRQMYWYTDVRKVWYKWEFDLLLFTLYALYVHPDTLPFSQPLYHVCADFAQHIVIDSSTTVCNSGCLALNSSATCLWVHPWRSLRSTISTLSYNFYAIFSLLNFNL